MEALAVGYASTLILADLPPFSDTHPHSDLRQFWSASHHAGWAETKGVFQVAEIGRGITLYRMVQFPPRPSTAMLNITVVCPRCGEQVLIPAESFESVMPIYDECEMESHIMCDCGMVGFNVRIVLEEDENVDALHIGNIIIEPLVAEN